MSSAARDALPEDEETSGRLAWLVGDILSKAADAGWEHVSDDQSAEAVLVVHDDPDDQISAADMRTRDTRPMFLIRLGQLASEHAAVYPRSDESAFITGSLVNPPDIGTGFEGMQLAASQWLRGLPPAAETIPEVELQRSVETLVARISDLSEDRDRLLSLLMRSEQDRGRLQAEVERLSDLLEAKALEGQAVLRGDPISRSEAGSLATGVKSIMTHMLAGIVGNRADALFVETIRSAAPELLDLAHAVVDVFQWTGTPW